jgi:glycosyltransferase involved in cell wall biosynthesis
MRVLMVNRPDAFTVPGGDTVQMVETARCLREMGVDLDIRLVGEIASLHGYDLVHVFNWEQMEPLLAIKGRCGNPALPIVLTPIFMFQTGHWYGAAIANKCAWRQIDRCLGPTRGRASYQWWQRAKLRHSTAGERVRRIISSAAWLLPLSHSEIHEVTRLFGIREDLSGRSTITPNGIDPAAYLELRSNPRSSSDESASDACVLQVARIQSEKNQLGLIEALYDTTLPLVFVGQPSPYEPEYVQACYDLGRRRGNVSFLGAISHDHIAHVYARAAVHVLPSWREALPIVCLEAAAAGCRIVSTVVGGIREYFGDAAWYCDPGDPDSIRSAVIQAYEAGPSDSLMNKVRTTFTWSNVARKTLDAYQAVLANS